MGRVPHRPLPVGIEQIVPEEPGRRDTSAACHLRHPPDEVHDVVHEVVGGDIVCQDRGVVAGAPPIFTPAHLHVAFAILLHDCEGRRRKMPAWGRCHQPVGAGGVQTVTMFHPAGGAVGPTTRPSLTSATSSCSRVSQCSPGLAPDARRRTYSQLVAAN